ncbi:putative quinol monooxygenase [Methanococcoides alaskense]|uniref:Quinol monooxygenase YgiN n=1 Tax=Methanococcoides alaskense TaxID=325778 RepID=A0AA90ZAM1_9EURY|nr:putative quinol monooxygenase [Methanococcoides alaskense]MDA0524362.1 putative quinol monooxygenase [Methanococcoides alaskense]MDR6223911.1 quinol monooxygenase YgiN [Methanococcoides alaskense]
MITIVAKTKVRENKKQEFLKITEELIQKSQNEEGCISYDLYEDIADPYTLTFIESWEDMEAIDLHNKAEHFMKIVPKLADLTEGEIEVRSYRPAK